MAKVLIVYWSRTGNTEKMAHLVAEGVKEAGCEVQIKKADETTPDDLKAADGIIMGSPTYYGLPAAELVKLLDDSVCYHGQLDGKVGGAFSSAANIGGGNETTIMGLLEAMLIHGFVIQGTPAGDHYGPVSIGAPDNRVTKQCRAYGKRIGELAKKLHG